MGYRAWDFWIIKLTDSVVYVYFDSCIQTGIRDPYTGIRVT